LTEKDPRNTPSYRLNEASHYLRIPKATLRSWLVGAQYQTKSGKAFFRPVICIADTERLLLSFINLVEAHVLDAIRRQHEVPLQKVRQALTTLSQISPASGHPLASYRFQTDGKHLLIERLGQLINLNEQGQLEMKATLDQHLKRIVWARDGAPAKLFPFTRKRQPDEPKAIVIDPNLSFGRPVLAGTGIATAVIAERYKAGESISDLAKDYGRKALEIEEAIRCELSVQAG
jgi:uncharacterized protein (DUF433 family)